MVTLTGETLTLDEVKRVVFDQEKAVIADSAIHKIKRNRETVENLIAAKKTIYGINTGFGKLSDIVIADEDLDDLQLNLIHSHACGVGAPFSEEISRTMQIGRAHV